MGRVRLAIAAIMLAALAAAGSAWADVPKASIEGVSDGALRAAIARIVGTSKRPPASRFDARRRADEAAQDAVTVLRSEGYYDYTVTADVEAGAQSRAVVRIDPGPRSLIAAPEVAWVSSPPPIPEAEKDALDALKLKPGTPGRAAEVVAAEGRVVGALQKDGYADAKAQPRRVVVDHSDHTVRPTFRIDPKSRVKLGLIKLQTTGRTNPKWVGYLAPWRLGELYKPASVAELERRLLDTGVYNSVVVSLAPTPEADGLRPVIVSLADRPHGTLTLGASYSTSEGPGVTGRYSIYNRLGRADTLTFTAQYASILKEIDVQLSLPHWRRAQTTLKLGATAFKNDTTAYDQQDAGVRADIEKRFAPTSFRTFGVSLDYTNEHEKTLVDGQIVGVRRKLEIATVLARLSLDKSDDPLDPTRGWRVDGRVEPTVATGDQTLAYAKVDAQGSAYLPVSGSTVLAARLRLGTILSGSANLDVPASRRFFSGGGGSIRGYGYQKVGPQFPDGTPVGGQSLAEGSFEVRQKFGPQWGAVAFVDAGTVGAARYPNFRDVSVGAGVGVRYNLGFGPLRADIAVPLNRRHGDAHFQVYLSIGQSF